MIVGFSCRRCILKNGCQYKTKVNKLESIPNGKSLMDKPRYGHASVEDWDFPRLMIQVYSSSLPSEGYHPVVSGATNVIPF